MGGGDMKHLVLVKFKEAISVQEIIEGMERLASEVEYVKAFEWGQDVGSEELLRQGFTHVFILTFGSHEDFMAYSSHPSHLEFAGKFMATIEKVIVFDYTPVLMKSMDEKLA
ncbi:stress-response A/B barrel domain-containing protein At5g22580 [Amborella trichopoda]|uniref:Stress-response A/B barrel domain-containing protein n=1 Tax=Amborella trichopoda TaxID=13333 RepID=W1PT31_AMBTC|nr:stress-response A/B barrel domain-containing protein At5g22580 [Amborella trichopoda]ERN13157.1 hypothetical protein AMTR_s00040p00198790 [Amborella trichopoda]|eukprot:XP_006851621.1 stress-response A/B barrel domain-containing protein At5g22580 [Amborella trichopoda]